MDEGIRLGVTVTPAFFIYGQLIVGRSQTILPIPRKFLQFSHKLISHVKAAVRSAVGRLDSCPVMISKPLL